MPDRVPARPRVVGRSGQLPRGRHGLQAQQVADHQRERIIAALAAVCLEKGYRATTVQDIIVRAGVSRRTFYDMFTGKQDCFIVAYELLSAQIVRLTERAYADERWSDWERRIDASIGALLRALASQPGYARLLMVEVLVAGDPARGKRDEMLARFEEMLAPAADRLPIAPADRRRLAQAVIGGCVGALYSRIAAGQVASLPEIRSQLLYCVLVPYIGHPRALAASGIEPQPA